MTDQTANDQHRGIAQRCPSCGAAYAAGDRFCAECGTALPAPAGPREPWPVPAPATPPTVAPLAAAAISAPAPAPAPDGAPSQRDSLWLLAAKPASVIGGGFLLLLLAAILLFAGQADRTGTIVMLSICLTPLALLTLLIGIARAVIG